MTTLAIIDQARSLVEALADSGNYGAGRIVEQTVDHLEALADKLVATEDSLKLAHQQVSSLLAVVEELRK